MISAQEMVNEVNGYRRNNQKIIEEYCKEISNRIYDAAKRGEREYDVNLWSMAWCIPSNKGKSHDDEFPSIGIQKAIWDKLKSNGFRLEPSMGLDGHYIEWARIVKW